MFSTEKNVEKIADLILVMKDYIKLQADYLQLNTTEKFIRIVSLFILSVILWFFSLLVLFFLSMAAVYYLNIYCGQNLPVSFLIVGAFHLCLFVLIYLKRHSWIEKPLVRRLANIIIDKTK